jgi:hypothetical protein
MSRSEAVERLKWTSSTARSTEVAVAPAGTVTAASSPLAVSIEAACGERASGSIASRSRSLAISSNSERDPVPLPGAPT